jgi:hypothetical protein
MTINAWNYNEHKATIDAFIDEGVLRLVVPPALRGKWNEQVESGDISPGTAVRKSAEAAELKKAVETAKRLEAARLANKVALQKEEAAKAKKIKKASYVKPEKKIVEDALSALSDVSPAEKKRQEKKKEPAKRTVAVETTASRARKKTSVPTKKVVPKMTRRTTKVRKKKYEE